MGHVAFKHGSTGRKGPKYRTRPRWPFFGLILCALLATGLLYRTTQHDRVVNIPRHLARVKVRCAQLKLKPGPPPDFSTRTVSDRFVSGTPATLIRNATIWTGRVDGTEVIHGDMLLDNGLISAVGRVHKELLDSIQNELVTVEAHGAWVSSGCGFLYFLAKLLFDIRSVGSWICILISALILYQNLTVPRTAVRAKASLSPGFGASTA